MLMRVCRSSRCVILALIPSTCFLRVPSIGTKAFSLSTFTAARGTAKRAMVNTMGPSGIQHSRRANRTAFSTDCYLLSAGPWQRLRSSPPFRKHSVASFSAPFPPSPSSSSTTSSKTARHASSAGATDPAVPSEAGVEQNVGQEQGEAGQGFGVKAAVETPKNGGKPPPQQRQRPPKKPQPKAPLRGNNLLVVGLGNPGDKFKMTRHNAGFMVAEELARRHGGTLKIKTAFQGEYCSVTVKGKSVGILRPITFMNNSGMSVRKVVDFFKLPTNAALVLVDEVALDFGHLRLKGKGGSGGHNGLKSLQAHLKTPDYSRLKIGVGAPRSSLSDYVLGDFSRMEKKELDNVIAEACDAVEQWVEEEDMARVMTSVNSR